MEESREKKGIQRRSSRREKIWKKFSERKFFERQKDANSKRRDELPKQKWKQRESLESESVKGCQEAEKNQRPCVVSSETERNLNLSIRSPEKLNPSPLFKRPPSWTDQWLKNTKALKHVVFAMQLQSLSEPPFPSPRPQPPFPNLRLQSEKTPFLDRSIGDRTLLLTDDILLRILYKLPKSQQNPNSLVCKRWLNLQGRLVRSVKVLDWKFLESGRLISRFPNLNHVNLIYGCMVSPPNSAILLSHKVASVHINSDFEAKSFLHEKYFLSDEVIDRGLKALANGCPNLRKLVVIAGSQLGLLSVAEECHTLQDLELHQCSDNALRAIAACENLQVLKLIGNVDGIYSSSSVSDIGLTILAQGCKRLVKLELTGCEGSYDGIKAIGQCCQMLEELTLCDHRMDGGWLAALSYCENLKSLKIRSCKVIDQTPGPNEYLGYCQTLERLHLQKCQLRDKHSVKALFTVCGSVREIIIQDCWGLDNDTFSMASICRRVKFLSLEGCSLLKTEGLESVILFWKELERLKVVSCNSISDSEVSPTLSTLFTLLKELIWRPDTKSLLWSSLVGTGMGKKGGKFFKKS